MAFINKSKFFNRYLPMFLSVVLIVGAVFTYLIYQNSQTVEAAVVVDTTTAGAERTGLVNGSTFTSNSFSTGGSNELVLAMIQADPISSGAVLSISSLTGAGLTWHLAKRQNANNGSAEVWYSFAASTLSSQALTATLSAAGPGCGAGCSGIITVVAFSGTDTTGVDGSGAIGATNGCGSSSGTPSCSLTTTRNGSLVLASLFNWTNATVPTVPAGQTAFGGVASGTGEYFWGQRQNAVTPISGTSVTINDTAPTGINYSEAIVEILATSPPAVPAHVTVRGSRGGGGTNQVQKKSYVSTAGNTTHSIVLNSVPQQGDLLILGVVSNTTVSTPAGWTLAASAVDFTGTYLFYKIAGAGELQTITVTLNGSHSATLTAFEYSGIDTSSPLDKTATAIGQGGASTIITGTTATTVQNNELLVALVGIYAGPVVNVSGWSNSFVQEYNVVASGGSGQPRQGIATRIVSSTGTYSSTGTLTSSNDANDSGIIATFKIVASSPDPNVKVRNGGPGLVTIAMIQATTCQGGTTNGSYDCTITSTGAGNLLVIAAQLNDITTTISGVSGGGTWVHAPSSRSLSTVCNCSADFWYVKSSTAGATTVTVTRTGITNGGGVVWEFSGTDLATPLDQVAILSDQSATTNPLGPSVTTAVSGEVVLSSIMTGGGTSAVAAPFTNDWPVTPKFGSGFAHSITTNSGTFTPSWTTTNFGWGGSTVSFKAASVPGGNVKFR